MTLPGALCEVGLDVCETVRPHSHCGCGWPIEVGGGYCGLCIRELIRGAVMGRIAALPEPSEVLMNGLEALTLPTGHKNWQTTDHCRYGHDMTPGNTYWIRGQGGRQWRCCTTCRRISARASYHRGGPRRRRKPPTVVRRCAFCNSAFVAKRSDHQYCSRVHRIAHYNQLARRPNKEAA